MIELEVAGGIPNQPLKSVNLGGFEVTGQNTIKPDGLHNIILPPGTTVELPGKSPLAGIDLSGGKIDDTTLLLMFESAVRVSACGVVNIDQTSGTLAATDDGMNLVLTQFLGTHEGMQISQTGISQSELTVNGQPNDMFPFEVPAEYQVIR
jgi:hypothetical protein